MGMQGRKEESGSAIDSDEAETDKRRRDSDDGRGTEMAPRPGLGGGFEVGEFLEDGRDEPLRPVSVGDHGRVRRDRHPRLPRVRRKQDAQTCEGSRPVHSRLLCFVRNGREGRGGGF